MTRLSWWLFTLYVRSCNSMAQDKLTAVQKLVEGLSHVHRAHVARGTCLQHAIAAHNHRMRVHTCISTCMTMSSKHLG